MILQTWEFLFLVYLCPLVRNFVEKLAFIASVFILSDCLHDESMVSISFTFILSVLQMKLNHIYQGT